MIGQLRATGEGDRDPRPPPPAARAGPVGMLLCLSSRQWRVFEEPVEVSGEVALEAAGGLAAAFPFLDSTLDVVDRRSVHSASGNDDLVKCSVELSVAAAVEPVADRLAGRGGGRGGARASRASGPPVDAAR